MCIKLSQNFSLAELTQSATAKKLGLENSPDDSAIVSLLHLCQTVLQPLREHFGVPITISSGYRSPPVNKAVGGVGNSQHLKGEAADIHIPSLKVGKEWFEYISAHLPFDQLIWEHNKNGVYWIHVSCKRDIKKNRQQVINNLLKT